MKLLKRVWWNLLCVVVYSGSLAIGAWQHRGYLIVLNTLLIGLHAWLGAVNAKRVEPVKWEYDINVMDSHILRFPGDPGDQDDGTDVFIGKMLAAISQPISHPTSSSNQVPIPVHWQSSSSSDFVVKNGTGDVVMTIKE